MLVLLLLLLLLVLVLVLVLGLRAQRGSGWAAGLRALVPVRAAP